MTELNFKGKEFVYNHHLAVPFRPLEPHPKKGIGPVAFDGNLIIHGDNLHALKALLPMYAGKVDCIFIDPPYNTGNEGWAYNDNVNAPMIKDWLNANPVGIEDGLRHDKWCAMMWPRLQLLHELLAENGVIFICIDDNESHRLRMMLDDIFGSDLFVAEIIWRSSDSSRNDAKRFSLDHNTVFVYSKNRDWVSEKLERDDATNAHYSNPDKDPRGPWFPGNLSSPNPRENLRYTIKHADGRTLKPPANGWRWSKELLQAKIKSGEITFVDTERGILRKTYLSEQGGISPSSLWTNLDETGHNRQAKYELKRIFSELDTAEVFATPKPMRLIRKALRIVGNRDAIVLDSFAGSATTAHAVLEANKRDGGNRRFILVEMESYADKLTAERVRRVIKGYKFEGTQRTELLRENLNWRAIEHANDLVQRVKGIENLEGPDFDRITKQVKDGELIVTGEKAVTKRAEGLGGEFTYCTLGEPVELDKVLSGESLPPYPAIGAALFHMATNQALDPKAMENVPLAARSQAWADARMMLVKAGYGLTETKLDASLYGVPQRRRRLFVIGRIGEQHGFLESALASARSAQPMTIRDMLGNALGDACYFQPRVSGNRGIWSTDGPAPTICRFSKRPIPPNYKPHPADAALVETGAFYTRPYYEGRGVRTLDEPAPAVIRTTRERPRPHYLANPHPADPVPAAQAAVLTQEQVSRIQLNSEFNSRFVDVLCC